MKFATSLFILVSCLNTWALDIVQRNSDFRKSLREIQKEASIGDIVGNGGGIMEAKFQYNLLQLSSRIQDCLENYEICDVSIEDSNILSEVIQVLNKSNLSSKLWFVSNKKTNNWFFDSEDREVRIAKTGFSSEFPIVLNLDIMYYNSRPILNTKDIVTILIHELGHQAKHFSHSVLNSLGAKVASYIATKKLQISIPFESKTISLNVYNYNNVDKKPNVFLQVDQEYKEVSQLFSTLAVCKEGVSTGYQLFNLYWTNRIKTSLNMYKVEFGAWLDVNCTRNGSYIEKTPLEVIGVMYFSSDKKELLDIKVYKRR